MDDYRTDVANLCAALRKGIEKVISTIGIHEVRGYARLFSCIGLRPELAAIFDTPAYFGSEKGGTGFAELDADGDERAARSSPATRRQSRRKTFHFYPKVYKAAVAAANGSAPTRSTRAKVRELELAAADLAAPHPRPASPTASRSPVERATPRSATTTTRS